jgi:hypothetical protein
MQKNSNKFFHVEMDVPKVEMDDLLNSVMLTMKEYIALARLRKNYAKNYAKGSGYILIDIKNHDAVEGAIL